MRPNQCPAWAAAQPFHLAALHQAPATWQTWLHGFLLTRSSCVEMATGLDDGMRELCGRAGAAPSCFCCMFLLAGWPLPDTIVCCHVTAGARQAGEANFLP